MIKIVEANKDGKIELTKEELEEMLNEAYYKGYSKANRSYIMPLPYYKPEGSWYVATTTTSSIIK